MAIKLTKLAEIAKKAGDAIAAMQADIVQAANDEDFNRAHQLIEYKQDDSPVTAADKKANEIVCAGLKEHFPGIAIVSEENSPESNAQATLEHERFETDPLDNTTGYIKGHDGYSVNIGRVVDGVPTEGVIYFPGKKEMYFTNEDGTASYMQKGDAAPQPIHVNDFPRHDKLKVAVGFNEQLVGHLGEHEHEDKALPGQLRTISVATGDFDVTGANRGRGGGFNSYDLLGPHAVLCGAGGDIAEEGTGKFVRYPAGTTKVPAHIAGSLGVLKALGLVEPALLRNRKNEGERTR